MPFWKLHSATAEGGNLELRYSSADDLILFLEQGVLPFAKQLGVEITYKKLEQPAAPQVIRP